MLEGQNNNGHLQRNWEFDRFDMRKCTKTDFEKWTLLTITDFFILSTTAYPLLDPTIAGSIGYPKSSPAALIVLTLNYYLLFLARLLFDPYPTFIFGLGAPSMLFDIFYFEFSIKIKFLFIFLGII